MRAQLKDRLKPLRVTEASDVKLTRKVPSGPDSPPSVWGGRRPWIVLPLARNSSLEPARSERKSWPSSVSSLARTIVVKQVVDEGTFHDTLALFV